LALHGCKACRSRAGRHRPRFSRSGFLWGGAWTKTLSRRLASRARCHSACTPLATPGISKRRSAITSQLRERPKAGHQATRIWQVMGRPSHHSCNLVLAGGRWSDSTGQKLPPFWRGAWHCSRSRGRWLRSRFRTGELPALALWSSCLRRSDAKRGAGRWAERFQI
jgi:hypothetical protein